MKIAVYDLTGKKTKDITLDDQIFGVAVNKDLLAQAVRVYLSNQRQASGRTKTRSEIEYTKKKMYRQKGTGNARHGSKRAAIFVGGFKAHGPRAEHHYTLELPKKMRKAALKNALSAKVAANQLIAIDGLSTLKTPKTKTMKILLQGVAKDAKRLGLILMADMDHARKSAHNLPEVACCPAESLTAYEVLNNGQLIFALEAIEAVTKRLKK